LAVALLGGVILNWNRVSADITNIGDIPVCLIEAPGTAPMLVHAGSRFYGRRVAQSLQQQGVNRLSALVLPVADEQHAGGALDILAAFCVKELWCATTNARSPVFRQVLAAARERNVPIRVMSDGNRIMLGNRLECQYQAVSNEFIVRRSETVIRIGRTTLSQNAPETRSTLHALRSTFRGSATSAQDPPDTVDIEVTAKPGRPHAWHIRCVEPGEVLAESNGVDGGSWISLVPGQGRRVYMDESGCRVEPLENH
jgi:hypothetical protein